MIRYQDESNDPFSFSDSGRRPVTHAPSMTRAVPRLTGSPFQFPAPTTTASPLTSLWGEDDAFSDFESMARDRISRLNTPLSMHPALLDAIGALKSLMGASDPGYDAFAPIAQKRLAELDKPAYTDAQKQIINTQAIEPLEQQRSVRKQQAVERAGARGMAESSGLLELDTRDIDKSFDANRATTERGIALSEIQANEARQQEAVQIGQALASLSGKNLPVRMSAANSLAGLGQSMMALEDSRGGQALDTMGMLANMGPQRMMLALNALNSLQGPMPNQPDNSGMIGLLMQLMNMGENAYGRDQQTSGGIWGLLGQMLPEFLNFLPQGGGMRTSPIPNIPRPPGVPGLPAGSF